MADAVPVVDPQRFAVFASDLRSTAPIARLPVYAEIVWAEIVSPAPPPAADDRFVEQTNRAVAQEDDACDGSPECRERIREEVGKALAAVLPPAVRDALREDFQSGSELIAEALRDVLEGTGAASLSEIDDETLAAALEGALREAAERRALDVEPLPAPPPPPAISAYPLGLLATDHVGFASFDLARLPGSVGRSLAEAIGALRRDEPAPGPDEPPRATIWLYPFGHPGMRFDGLQQRRFTENAIVMRLDLETPVMPDQVRNLGLLAMQNPGLTEWRLSPGSFATNPGALIGADGCETLLPANVALHEYNFYQVIGLSDEALGDLPPATRGRLRAGVVNEFRVSFIPIGHSLGQILYSFPLAPGESVNFAVIDWTRRDAGLRKEDTKFDESLTHELRRDRVISETVKASIEEWQRGGSIMGGIATSVGGAMGSGGMGIAAGMANSLGGAYSTTRGSRDIAADTMQKLSDNISQASAASRELHSTVVVQTSQAEHQAVETRTVVNYNHSHALTVLYYEVLRHFRLVSAFVRRRPALLTNVHGGITMLVSENGEPPRTVVYWPVILENRKAIEAALLDPRLKDGIDAEERRRHRDRIGRILAPASPPPPPPTVGPEFRHFVFEMRTGGLFAERGEDEDVHIHANIELNKAPWTIKLNDGNRIDPPGSFFAADHTYWFTARSNNPRTVFWGDVEGISIYVWLADASDSDTDVAFSFIKVTGVDVNGGETLLFEKNYEAGHVIIDNNYWLTVPARRPVPPPPPPPRPADEIEDEARVAALEEHLLHHRAHYERALRLGLSPAQRAAELGAVAVPGGILLERVDNRPLEVLGDFVAYPCVDPIWSDDILEAVEGLREPDPQPIERLVTLPTRGVFAEAKLGHCNASEEIDNTRFWDWQQSPIPHMAPEIAAVQTVVPQAKSVEGLDASSFPNALLNIVNPPAAPDPTGMSAVMTALATANIFRDMSGRQEVADLLKKLSDNSVAIAQVAQKAAGGQATPTGSGTGQTPPPPASSGQTAPPASSGATATPPAPQQPPQPTPEQRESQNLQNQRDKLQIARDHLPPKDQKPVQQQVRDELAKKKTAWTLVFTAEWFGEGLQQVPMLASHACHVVCGPLVDDNVFLPERYTDEEVIWQFEHAKVPLSATFHASQITPPGGSFKVKVPGITVEDLHLVAKDYEIPLRTAAGMPETMKYTVGNLDADPAKPILRYRGTGKLARKEITVQAKLVGGTELSGEFSKAFEKEATIEIVKLAVSSTLKAATKIMLGGEVGIQGTFEIIYLVGYEVKKA